MIHTLYFTGGTANLCIMFSTRNAEMAVKEDVDRVRRQPPRKSMYPRSRTGPEGLSSS
jgi:hypothetical protein